MYYDVIVIGAGLAGLMAAEAAQSRGARVSIFAQGMGSLPLTTGCIDVLGYLPSIAKIPISSPRAALTQFREDHPHHPYNKVGEKKMFSGLTHFLELCRANGLPFEGNLDSNFLLPTALGTLHPTCLAPETMNAGHLSIPGSALLLGFEGIKDFSPFMAAENLNLLHSQGKIAISFRAQLLKKMDLHGKSFIGLNLAQAFDDRAFREEFATLVRPLIRKGEKLGLPAVLGFRSPREALVDLREKLSTEIFEIPLPPPSIPGLRLYNSLKSYFKMKGGRLILGLSSLKPLTVSGRVQGFTLGDAKTSPTYRASAFVLATGKFVGGGLNAAPNRIYETLFGLPVKHPPNRQDWFTTEFLSPEGQPFNSFGLEVDENLRPVDFSGRVIYENLFAAGGIIAHADSMSEKSGGGVAISTGHLAGKLAAEFAQTG